MFIGWSLALAVDVADVRAALETYNAGAVHRLPALTDAQVAELVAGGCVRLMAPNADPDGPSSAVGMVLSDVPRAALWVAAQDPHAVVDPDLTEFVVEQIGPDEAIWYGYWDLPKPVHDRQWVIRSWNNHALASRTGGAAWEHVWRRVDDGLSRVRPVVEAGKARGVDLAMVDHAIETPVNEGSWSMIHVGDRTLIAYQASSVVGGAVPDWLVARLVMARLETVLRSAEQRARAWAPGHYVAGHPPLLGGDGKAIGAL